MKNCTIVAVMRTLAVLPMCRQGTEDTFVVVHAVGVMDTQLTENAQPLERTADRHDVIDAFTEELAGLDRAQLAG